MPKESIVKSHSYAWLTKQLTSHFTILAQHKGISVCFNTKLKWSDEFYVIHTFTEVRCVNLKSIDYKSSKKIYEFLSYQSKTSLSFCSCYSKESSISPATLLAYLVDSLPGLTDIKIFQLLTRKIWPASIFFMYGTHLTHPLTFGGCNLFCWFQQQIFRLV